MKTAGAFVPHHLKDAPHDLPMSAHQIYGENGFFRTLQFFFRISKKLKQKVKNYIGKVKKKLKIFRREKKLKCIHFLNDFNFPQNRTI